MYACMCTITNAHKSKRTNKQADKTKQTENKTYKQADHICRHTFPPRLTRSEAQTHTSSFAHTNANTNTHTIRAAKLWISHALCARRNKSGISRENCTLSVSFAPTMTKRRNGASPPELTR